MYERFTDRSRNVMQLANQEAQRYKHEFIGTEHILLGLAKEDSGVAANVLKVFGVEPVRIIAQIERLLQEGPPGGRTDRLPQTPRAKNVIMYSMEEARSLKHDYVGTEHLLLGLLREEEGVAAQVLMNLGVRLDTARAEIRAILSWLSEHDESGEYSPQSRIHFDKDHPKTVEEPPKACPKSTPPAACPKCGGHLVRVLWHCVHLSGQDQKDVGAGKAILGSCSDMAGPPWACLRCSPNWSEVHALAMQDYQLQLAKETAVASQDFDGAVRCRDAQLKLRRQSSQVVEELLKNPWP